MKGIVTVVVGLLGALAFAAAWVFDPGPQATMAVTLVCGFATVLGQLSTRDLLGRAQALIDRGADEVTADGGELLSQSRIMKDRIERFVLAAQVTGILAPFFGALRALYDTHLWSALAATCAFVALILSVWLFFANRALSKIVDADRERRARAKAQRDAAKPITDFSTELDQHPNLKGYGSGEPDIARPI